MSGERGGDSYGFPGWAASASAEAIGGDAVGDDGALGISDAHLAEAEAAAPLGDAALGPEVDAAGGGGEVDREGDGRGGRVLRDVVGCPGRRHRRGVDQSADGAAVNDLADRRQLRLEGQLEHRLIRTKGDEPDYELVGVGRVRDELFDDLPPCRVLAHAGTVFRARAAPA